MVYTQRNKTQILIVLLVVLTAVLVASLFIRSTIKLSSYSLVLPEEKWLVTLGGGGQIISNLINNVNGQTVQYNITQFERGEFVNLNFANSLSKKREFSKGDTVLAMNSSNVRDQLITALGELQIATAKYKSLSSAEKESLINEAKTKLAYVEEKISEQKVLVERTKQLFDKGYSSQQEFELQKWNLNLLNIEKEIFSSQLENLKTGVKPEELELVKSEINSVMARMDFLKERESQLVVLSPLNGKVAASLSPDTLLVVINSQKIVMNLPIKIANYKEFTVGQEIPLQINGSKTISTGKVISVDQEVKIVNQQQVVLVSILAENSAGELLPGMVTEVTLKLGEISLFQHLLRFFAE